MILMNTTFMKTIVAAAVISALTGASTVRSNEGGPASDGSTCYANASGDWSAYSLQASIWTCYTNNGTDLGVYPGLKSSADIRNSYRVFVSNNQYARSLNNSGTLDVYGTLVLGGDGKISNSSNSPRMIRPRTSAKAQCLPCH